MVRTFMIDLKSVSKVLVYIPVESYQLPISYFLKHCFFPCMWCSICYLRNVFCHHPPSLAFEETEIMECKNAMRIVFVSSFYSNVQYLFFLITLCVLLKYIVVSLIHI